MQKTRSIAKIYLHQSSFSLWDLLALGVIVVSAVIFFINPLFCIPLLCGIVVFLLSRSAHVSDKEYEQLLSHIMAFNTVREERHEGFEEMYQFFIQGYLEKKTFVDFYLKGYDLGRGTVRCGDDKELRSGYYSLFHLCFTDTHCEFYILDVDIARNTVTDERFFIPRTSSYEITPKTVTYRGGKTTIHYLCFPECQPIPVHLNNTELEEILAFFTDKR